MGAMRRVAGIRHEWGLWIRVPSAGGVCDWGGLLDEGSRLCALPGATEGSARGQALSGRI